MAAAHPSTRYTYKSPGPEPPTEHPSLEQLVKIHLDHGHQYFFQGRYADALQQYKSAYSLVFKLLHPDFPDGIVAQRLELVRGLDIIDPLLAASAEIARFRHAAGQTIPIVAPGDPPVQVRRIVERFGGVNSAEPRSPAQNFYRMGVNYLRMGSIRQAQRFLRRASAAIGDGASRLEADVSTAIGVTLMRQRDPVAAQQAFARAQELYARLQLGQEEAVVQNNMGVLHTAAGNDRSAAAAFRAAADRLPLSLGRTLRQPLDSDDVSVIVRPAGGESLNLILRYVDSDDGWVTLPIDAPDEPGAEHVSALIGDRTVELDLQADPVSELKQKIYEPRVAAQALSALATHQYLVLNFVWFIPHIYGFTLPLSIGDCYFEMDDYERALPWYEKARDYAFLNQPIESPLVWQKMAKTFLHWGNTLSESNDSDEARLRYERIVRLSEPIVDPESPLYHSPVFDGVRAQVEAILAAPQPLDLDVHDPSIAEVVLLARLNLQRIELGVDLPLLSLEREQTPVFSFDYLQNVARYFADHAIQAERTYIHFKTSAEQEEFTRAMLENAVELEQANEMLEAKKVEVAEEQRDVLDANLQLADLQRQNAIDHRAEFADVSLREIAVDEDLTYIGAPTMEHDFYGYEEYGIADGTHRVDEVLRTLTRHRRQISREFELSNLDRHISELDAARAVAQEQGEVAAVQVELARMQHQIAGIRRQQAEAQLALFDSQEFTPDLWNRLANNIKAISKSYLHQAIVIARLMEQAYEFELGQDLNIIKPNYTHNELSGLLGGDYLLRDIDSFAFWRIVLARKRQPVKESISLADRYPVQFLRQFQRTGRMEFRTELADFDRNFPGGYQHRIKQVEVVVEGLVGRGGFHGTLTNTGLCLTRLRDGDIKLRLLKPETLLISQYRPARDGIVFRSEPERLAVFENGPVATSWVLEFPPRVNDLIYHFITDVKLVIYYEAFFDPALEQLVLEELAQSESHVGRRTTALRYELFDEFFAFQDTGEIRFMLRDDMLPFYHTGCTIRELTILVRTDEEVSAAGLAVQVSTADSTEATQTTDTDGAISTGAGAALSALAGQSWSQEWTIAIPQVLNQDRFDDGFQWSQVRDLILVAEYEFIPREG